MEKETLRSNNCSLPHHRPVCVLIAEDDNEMRTFLSSTLSRDGYEILEIADSCELNSFFSDISSILDENGNPRVDVIVSDICMPGKTSLDVLGDFKRVIRSVPIILITAFDDEQTFSDAIRRGAIAVFDKPFDIQEFKSFLINLAPSSTFKAEG